MSPIEIEEFVVLFLQVLSAIIVLLLGFWALITYATKDLNRGIEAINNRLDSMAIDIREIRADIKAHVADGHGVAKS